jgi:nucleoside-diphosphate-sugar epimerase
MSGARVLLTGAAGHLGSHVAQALMAHGAHVIAAVRPGGDLSRLAHIRDRLDLLPLDLALTNTIRALERTLTPANLIVHLGAAGVHPLDNDPVQLTRVNVHATQTLIDLAAAWQCETFVYTGSCFEYPEGTRIPESTPPAPRTPYAASKAAASALVLGAMRSGLRGVILRPFTVYGDGEAPHRVVSSTVKACLANQPFPLTGGEQTRDFIHVVDAAHAVLLACQEARAIGGVYNICTGDEVSIRRLVETVIEITKSSAVPLFGALPYRENEFFHLSGDPTRAQQAFGFRARIPLAEGVRATVEWVKQNRS